MDFRNATLVERPWDDSRDVTIPFAQVPVSREEVAGAPYKTQRLRRRRNMFSRLHRRLSL
jgi:hypothetical protein